MAVEQTVAPRRRLGVNAEHENYKWWALSCTSLGMLLATINSGTLIIALPDLERALHTSILSLVWVILAYMISSTVLVLFAGRLSDLFGRKQAYVLGFVLFALASLGAGFAGNGTQLIVWRILQGIGGAFLFANSSALVTDAFPREQLGLAMGTNTMVAAVGLVIGPVLGGALVAISWHWVFWFNVPFALLGSLWAWLILRELAKPDKVRGYDVPGVLTFVVGLTGLVYGLSRAGLSGWTSTLTIGGIIVGVVLLPIFVLIESRVRAPMLDLTIFKNKLFAAATAAAFINGLSRFALLFLFVFYFQGVKGEDPIRAGIELAPMAIGMLIASPIAGVYADRQGSRGLAAWGMVVSALALAGMTTLGIHTAYFWSALWLFIVGVGSGMFNSPNTAAMMGTVPVNRRGIAAGARTMLQNTGAVISIAFVLAVVTSSVPKTTLFKIFSGVTSGLSAKTLDPFVSNMHTALWVLAATSVVGAVVSLMRPKEAWAMAVAEGVLRIGELAREAGTTPRTVRYYEEIGLLAGSDDRSAGAHRTYTTEDVARLKQLLRLKSVLGLTLDELREVISGEDARERRREAWAQTTDPVARAQMLHAATGHNDELLELVRRRKAELEAFEAELNVRRARLAEFEQA